MGTITRYVAQKVNRGVVAVLSTLFLIGYAINGPNTGVIFVALGLLSWAVWPRERTPRRHRDDSKFNWS